MLLLLLLLLLLGVVLGVSWTAMLFPMMFQHLLRQD
jgi:hypothetical protein